MRNNFPLARFLESFPGAPFIAIYLGKPNNENRKSFIADLLDIVVDGEERELVDRYARDVVVIDTSPIRTVDFKLSGVEKNFLLAAGKASALEFLLKRNVDGGPTPEVVSAVRAEAEELRSNVMLTRQTLRKRRWKRGALLSLVALAVLVVGS